MYYNVQFISKREIALDTICFRLSRPKEFSFIAGQYVSIKLLHTPLEGEGGVQKVFSIASAPHQEYLEFSMRLSSSKFKQNINALEIGDEVQITGAVGNFVLDRKVSADRHIVFLVGGIGITPVQSILLQANHEQRPEKFTLFYSNRNIEYTAYAKELTEYSNIHLTTIHTLTDVESDVSWGGERGYITQEMVGRYVPNMQLVDYYIVGAGSFITAMKDMLLKSEVEKERIHFDNFG